MTEKQILKARYEVQLRDANKQLDYWQYAQMVANEQQEKWANIVADLLNVDVDPEAKPS